MFLAFEFVPLTAGRLKLMQTDYEKAIRKRSLVKVAAGLSLMIAVHLLGWVPATESYFDGRHDAFPLRLFVHLAHLAGAFLFLVPWLCFFIGLLELVMGMPFRAIAWD
ncbi:MAG: hypothetical protein ABI651_14915 [Verrucomicrobiota bacterium]